MSISDFTMILIAGNATFFFFFFTKNFFFCETERNFAIFLGIIIDNNESVHPILS